MKTILFDFGGVLIDNPEPGMTRYYASVLGVDKEKLHAYMAQHTVAWQGGDITERELWKKVAHDFDVPIPSAKTLWLDGFKIAYSEKNAMFDIAKKLQNAGHKIGILSNTESDVADYIRSLHDADFNYLFFSCEMRVSKPDDGIYKMALRELGSSPHDVIFIDDKEENVVAAQQLGIESFVFDTEERVIDRLQPHL